MKINVRSFLIFIVVSFILSINCEREKDYPCIDGDGNLYNTVIIGTQTWMGINLKTTKYNDGEMIPHVPALADWLNLKTPTCCWYDNEIGNKDIYGALYNWYAVNSDKLCPVGWHVPSDAEWTTLTTYLGEDVAAIKMREAGNNHWLYNGGTNESGFAALPGGCLYDSFLKIREAGFWLFSTDESPSFATYRFIHYQDSFVGGFDFPKWTGFSVRCIKD